MQFGDLDLVGNRGRVKGVGDSDRRALFLLVELDARAAHVRTGETNLGNLVTDIVRIAQDSDICILNSGTLRSDDTYGPGEIRVRDITAILPMEDMMVVLELTGAQVRAALENGVSKYPTHEGRFPQVSGILFVFDPDAVPGARIVSVDVVAADGSTTPLDNDASYRVSTKEYLASGKDGFTMFADAKVLVDGECGVMLPTALRNHFIMLNTLAALRNAETCFHKAVRFFHGNLERAHSEEATKSSDEKARRKSFWDREFAVNTRVEGRIRTVGQDMPSLSSP
mgnify:CR=1 FL=1